MKKGNKKPLVALLVIALCGAVAGVFAYFTSTDEFANIFKAETYHMEVTETFTSPEDWVPGTTTSKNVVATNKGNVDAAVRVSYTESWVDAKGQTLPLEKDGLKAAIINFADDLNSKWTKSTEGGVEYYYYNTKLAENDSTSSFIKSVTFNKDVKIDVEHDCKTEGNVKTCTTNSVGYAGGTYTLNIKVETVQYDQYKAAWETNVEIN